MSKQIDVVREQQDLQKVSGEELGVTLKNFIAKTIQERVSALENSIMVKLDEKKNEE